jgi:GNAT superfamily N-acetyltransferase
MYRICEVDGHDDEIADTLADLHRLTFFDSAPVPAFDCGHWWLTFHGRLPVAFAGIVPSTRAHNAGYFSRVGVIEKHCGQGLQLRMMRTVENRARRNGWNCIVSDTTENLASANNFIKAGYRLYRPAFPWAWPNTLYWKKTIRRYGRA